MISTTYLRNSRPRVTGAVPAVAAGSGASGTGAAARPMSRAEVTCFAAAGSLDHVVCAYEQGLGDRETEGARRLAIDDELNLGRQLHGQIRDECSLAPKRSTQ